LRLASSYLLGNISAEVIDRLTQIYGGRIDDVAQAMRESRGDDGIERAWENRRAWLG
jgi:ribosomal protein L18